MRFHEKSYNSAFIIKVAEEAEEAYAEQLREIRFNLLSKFIKNLTNALPLIPN